MTAMQNLDIKAIARLIEQVAAAEAMPHWRNLAAGDIVEKNGPDDVVTVADKAVERVLTRQLAALLPGSDVVGEEAVHADPGLLARLRQPGMVWVIDPIDGTSAFARGEAGFAVMVALIVDGDPVAGFLHAPALGQTTYAMRGEGAWQGPSQATAVRLPRPAAATGLSDLVGIVGTRAFSDARRSAVVAQARHFKSLGPNSGCAGIDYLELAAGRVDFALYSKSEPWDHLPGLAILTEQGFGYSRFDGSPYRPGDNTGGLLVSASATLLAPLRDVLLG
ncbi:MAG: inositol monophosphatase family protein [Hyphomicrobiaceae bacterium]